MTDEKNTTEPVDALSAGTEAEDFAPAGAHAETVQDAPAEDVAETPETDEGDTYDSVGDAFAALNDGPDAVDEAAPPQYGVGPFSVREVALGAIWVVAFIVSFFPIYAGNGAPSVWTSGIDWILTIGVPTIAVFLVGLRRLSPDGIRRVGSLGIDQFASVGFTVSMVIWLGILWSAFVQLANRSVFYASWVVWVEFILMLAGVLLTVFAPLFPTIGDDFRHRTEVPAHRIARPARPVVARPAVSRPAPVAPAAATAVAEPYADAPAAEAPSFDATDSAATDETAVATAAVDESPSTAAPASQAFWALAPVERSVVDAHGTPVFTIGPTAWALVVEDRGDSFVVRNDDGRIGFLNDVSGITRG